MNTTYKAKLSLWVIWVALMVSCAPTENPDHSKPEPPNIIFFIADDMYPEMFNCLPEGAGKNLTPNLDRLAHEGILFTNQYAVSPVCTPSRYNCLTGRYASRATNKRFLETTDEMEGQTVIKWNTFINQQDKALPHYLRELGYTTGMVGKSHVIEVNGLYRFPDYWADPKAPDIKQRVEQNYQQTVEAIQNNGFDYAGSIYHDNPNFIGLGELAVQNMDWIAEAGVDFIEQHHQHPFFLYFATTLPHQPYEPERSWQADPLITANGYLEEAPDVLPERHTLPERLNQAGLEGEDKENILWLDDALGALMAKLEEHQQLDNTIIFFFNDHGQRAKGTLYQGGVKSPSIVWRKGGFAVGNRTEAKVQNIDFAPTILEIAGGKVEDDQFDGKSFKPLLDGDPFSQDRALFFELGFARAIIKHDYKYYTIRYPQFAQNWTHEERKAKLAAYNTPRLMKKLKIANEHNHMAAFSHFSLVPGGELAENESYGRLPHYFDKDQFYNLKEDPTEQNNLINQEEHQQVFFELKTELMQHLAKMPGRFDI